MKMLCLLLLITAQNAMAQKLDIITVRDYFVQAANKEDSARQLINLLNRTDSCVPLLMGYKGATLIIMAKHVKNPLGKWKDFKKGKEILEKAIQNDSDNYELRFVRYSIQTHLPRFLNYDDDTGRDKIILMNRWDKLEDADLKERVGTYLRNASSHY